MTGNGLKSIENSQEIPLKDEKRIGNLLKFKPNLPNFRWIENLGKPEPVKVPAKVYRLASGNDGWGLLDESFLQVSTHILLHLLYKKEKVKNLEKTG